MGADTIRESGVVVWASDSFVVGREGVLSGAKSTLGWRGSFKTASGYASLQSTHGGPLPRASIHVHYDRVRPVSPVAIHHYNPARARHHGRNPSVRIWRIRPTTTSVSAVLLKSATVAAYVLVAMHRLDRRDLGMNSGVGFIFLPVCRVLIAICMPDCSLIRD